MFLLNVELRCYLNNILGIVFINNDNNRTRYWCYVVVYEEVIHCGQSRYLVEIIGTDSNRLMF